jgi:XRE family transcriptional regulator, regulator of sulfur utilization
MNLLITRRDLAVALVSVAVTIGSVTMAQNQTPVSAARQGAAPTPVTSSAILLSTAFDWNAMMVNKTGLGESRPVVRQPTTTLDELEMHVTTLNPGETSHAPHNHGNEELVLIDKGTVDVLIHGQWKRVGPGSIVFNAANEPHALRNVGEAVTQYHVINWKTAKTPATAQLSQAALTAPPLLPAPAPGPR